MKLAKSVEHFSEMTLKLLQQAGWYEGRQVNIGEVERLLLLEGFTVNEPARQFMREFNGLQWIKFPFEANSNIEGHLLLDAWEAAEGGFHNINLYSNIVGRPLCPIGQENQDVLMMDDLGRVYSGCMEYLDLIGQSGYEAIENIFKGKYQVFTRLNPI